MGLRQRKQVLSQAGHWLMPAMLIGVTLALQAGGETVREALQFDKALIAGGELFRLLTGHLVHLGWTHLVLNLSGLVLIWYLVGSVYGLWQWIAILLASTAAIDLGFWLFVPQLEWYVGLSGILHGVFAAGTIGLWASRRNEALLLALALLAKLVYEGLAGSIPGSEQAAGGPVITAAHLFGAIGGAAAALPISIISKRTAGR